MPDKSKGSTAAGIAIFGAFLTGSLGCVIAIVGMTQGQIGGAGVCLIAAAVAFSAIAYITLTD